ncbi:MAG: hypothetical protein RLZZ262_1698 [Bacteroidota bacterium]|jgi:hypothetical protein
MRKYFLLNIIGILIAHLGLHAEHRMGYVAPAFQIELDDTEWTFDTNAPTFWMINGYLKFKASSFVHRPTGLKLTVKALRLPEPFRLDHLDSLEGKSVHKEYKNLYSVYNAEYYERSYQLLFEEGYMVDLTCNKKMYDPQYDGLIKSFVDRFMCIGASALDRIAGYPLSPSANEDSLRNTRRSAFFNQRPDLLDKVYIDHYVLVDKTEQFTFTRWEKEMMKESFMLYTPEEMALADGQVSVPENVQWLMLFMPNHHFNLSPDSHKSLRRYIHRMYPEIDYSVERINRIDRKGVSFLIHNEDTARFFVVHRHPKTNTITSYSYTIARNENMGYEGAVMTGGKPNPKIWSMMPIDYKGLTFLVEEKTSGITTSSVGNFPKLSLHSAAYEMAKPIEFEQPKTGKDYAHAFYYEENGGRISKALEAMQSGNTDRTDKDIHHMAVMYSRSESPVVPDACIIKGPIILTDYDNDQDPELSVIYVSAGKILQLETYELQSEGIVKVANATMWPIIKKRKLVYQLLSFSMQSTLMQQSIKNYSAPHGAVAVEEYYEPHISYDDYGSMDVAVPMELPNDTPEIRQLDRNAQFKGGEQAMKKFIQNNLKIPENTKTKVTVYVYCTVQTDGRLKIQKTVNSNGLNDANTEEAKRVTQLMPAWEPASSKGKPAMDQVVIPFNFEKK